MSSRSSQLRDRERRASIRYKLQLPVVFHWNDGCERTECGSTHDIALDGTLVQSRTSPPPGADVRMEVLISIRDTEREVRLQCLGTVTRVVEENGITSFAVQGGFNDDQILRSEDLIIDEACGKPKGTRRERE